MGDAGQVTELNISPKVEAQEPSIDFAGTGRNVPWTTWYEPNAALGGKLQVFASRFNTAAGAWVPEGQDPRRRGPVAEHPHRQGRGESVGGGRRCRGRQGSGAVGGLAGAGTLLPGGAPMVFTIDECWMNTG